MNSTLNNWYSKWVLPFLTLAILSLSSCGSPAASSENGSTDPAPPAQAAANSQGETASASDFDRFLANFPSAALPHELDPKETTNNASGETAQALPPDAVTSYLGAEKGFTYYGYGKYTANELTILVYLQRQSDTYTWYAASFSSSGKRYASQKIAENRSDGTYTWRTSAQLLGNGEIKSHGYQSVSATSVLFGETYTCYAASSNSEFGTCETPPGALFLGRFKSKSPVDGDGGHDLWRLTTYQSQSNKAPEVLLERCYLNGEGAIDQCKRIGLITDEIFDGDSFKLIVDDVTGEMVPTYIIKQGTKGTWTLAVHWYDAESDSWIDDVLDSEF